MIEYRLALCNRSTSGMGAEIIADVFALTGDINDSGLQFTEELNNFGTLEFTLPLDHPSVTTSNFALGNREVHLYRNDGSGETLVFGGKLWTVDVDDWAGRFICYDFLHDLTRRVIHDDYAVQTRDMFDIVWDLVSATQARTSGNLALTRDFATRGVTRNYVACFEERRVIFDAIAELADAKSSFDFRVTPDKKLKLFSDHRGAATTVAFNDSNISSFRHSRDATSVETVVGVIGPDQQDCDAPSLYEATSSGGLSSYGVLDGTVDDDKIKDDNVREKTADEQLHENEVPSFQPEVTYSTPLQEVNIAHVTGYDVGFDDVNVGDTVAISTQSVLGPIGGFRDFNGSFRVMTKTVDVKRIGLETVTLTLDQVIT